jgi:NADH-quinone oxidoreductase subunit C
MTTALNPEEVAGRVRDAGIDGVSGTEGTCLIVEPPDVLEIASFLKTAPGIELDYLNHITGTDYKDYFELVYMLSSLAHKRSLVIKARLKNRDFPSLPSVTSLWQGADYQEREIFDLLGISFEDHPNMKRIFLWDGFEGCPLRKDFDNGA